MRIDIDEGYYFGLGVFETIAVYNGSCIFLDEHIDRINAGLKTLQINKDIKKEQIVKYIKENNIQTGAVKVSASAQNTIFTFRENPYTKASFDKGVILDYSTVIRNESSKFTYIKSFNYGDNITEKRKAHDNNIDEPIFKNSKNEICEGAVSNIFFVKDNTIYTPKTSCGLLNGIMRNYIIKNCNVKETIIHPEEISIFDESFITNSLMGLIPVKKISNISYSSINISTKIYQKYIKEYLI